MSNPTLQAILDTLSAKPDGLEHQVESNGDFGSITHVTLTLWRSAFPTDTVKLVGTRNGGDPVPVGQENSMEFDAQEVLNGFAKLDYQPTYEYLSQHNVIHPGDPDPPPLPPLPDPDPDPEPPPVTDPPPEEPPGTVEPPPEEPGRPGE